MPLRERTLLGHPIGLYVLFFTEMWERFSYYGMRALLVLYLVNYMKWSPSQAATVSKFYTTLVYVTPILGGLAADRLLGNTWAVIIGAALMAIGHFLMAFEQLPVFYAALVFLIFGNGFFKPNMSTQVGRLYPPNDERRDAAYTIFYMGINLGAFLSPLICGWLADNTKGGYHSGFTMAGIGMVIGLVTYVLGKPLIKEIDQEEQQAAAAADPNAPPTEEQAETLPSVIGPLNPILPRALLAGAAACLIAAGVLAYRKSIPYGDAAIIAISGICLTAMGYVMMQVRNALRDRIATILALGVFTVFFWGAFEQASTTLNLWADQSTNRYLTQAPPADFKESEASADPGAAAAVEKNRASGLARFTEMFALRPAPPGQSFTQWLKSAINPVPTAWFQSINALGIFVIAPLFAWMWVALGRRGWQPSIPMKMVLGLALMSGGTAVMIAATNQENKVTLLEWPHTLPPGIEAKNGNLGVVSEAKGKETFQQFFAGRLKWNAESSRFVLYGVLPEPEKNRIIETSAPAKYRELVARMVNESKDLKGSKPLKFKADELPKGFETGLNGAPGDVVRFTDQTFTVSAPLTQKEQQALLVSGGEPEFRNAIRTLSQESQKFRVSPWWLVWAYLLATLGELCLSPVGLSMVSKLAPVKYGTVVMGVWLFISALGNYVAGLMSEQWGVIPPTQYFLLTTVVVATAAGILLLLVRLITRMMHGVN